MKQIISFKKELPFKTKVSDITSISLERDINIEEDGIVSGVFHITGDYKMNEGSINKEDFSFDLPFDITLDPRYDLNTIKVDVDDFYYDLDDDILKVNIDLYIEAEYLDKPIEEDRLEESKPIVEEKIEEVKEEDSSELRDNTPLFEEIPIKEIPTEVEDKDDKEDNREDLFSNLDSSESYVTYYVYIVKENDTLDKIINKYNVTKEQLEDYNDLSDIKMGDKIIIPKCDEK